MINKEIANSVLTIGPSFKPVEGGIAQVMDYYNSDVFTSFRFIANSCPGSKLRKLVCAISAYISTFFILLLNRNIKILHIHTASKVSFKRSMIFAKLGFLFRRKVVMHIHAGSFISYYEINPEYVAKSLKQCYKVIALTELWKQRFELQIGLTNVEVINNLVPLPTLRDPINKKSDMVEALFLGAIKPEKGIFDLMEVIAAHKLELQGKFTLYVGGNEQTERLISEIHNNGIADIVKFEGWIGAERKIELMNRCSVLFLPSYIEGLPICIMEAMSYGLAIVASTIGGIPSIVNEGENGYLLSPGDKNKLWTAIQTLIENPELRLQMGNKSQQMIQPYYPENVAHRLEQFYKLILDK
ncbi:MAG: glycosyltransferase family 4 protein [Sodaliphilus sp.]